jgi:hypothetical protein
MSRNAEGHPYMGITDEGRLRLKESETALEPLALSIPDAQDVSGFSRSETYRRLAASDLRAVKSGSRTLILMASLRAHLDNLPAATFRIQKAKGDNSRALPPA